VTQRKFAPAGASKGNRSGSKAAFVLAKLDKSPSLAHGVLVICNISSFNFDQRSGNPSSNGFSLSKKQLRAELYRERGNFRYQNRNLSPVHGKKLKKLWNERYYIPL
jgi:hypothetical protein